MSFIKEENLRHVLPKANHQRWLATQADPFNGDDDHGWLAACELIERELRKIDNREVVITADGEEFERMICSLDGAYEQRNVRLKGGKTPEGKPYEMQIIITVNEDDFIKKPKPE